MRKLDIGMHRNVEINVNDEPGEGGACHNYDIVSPAHPTDPQALYAEIRFQKGPVLETGPNGIFIENLIAICIDRLRSFQAGAFKCQENAFALIKLEDALRSLNHRTRDRKNRGVEGTNKQ